MRPENGSVSCPCDGRTSHLVVRASGRRWPIRRRCFDLLLRTWDFEIDCVLPRNRLRPSSSGAGGPPPKVYVEVELPHDNDDDADDDDTPRRRQARAVTPHIAREVLRLSDELHLGETEALALYVAACALQAGGGSHGHDGEDGDVMATESEGGETVGERMTTMTTTTMDLSKC